jgi:formylmethanofuran dehydrogenase subunit E
MGLPQIDYATYQLTLPSTQQVIKYRAFNVKEEKILMMALESEDEGDMFNAIIQIIDNCTMGKIKSVEELPYFDIEHIFIQLRKKSIGEIITASTKCSKCEGEVPAEINLDEVVLNTVDEGDNVIQISDSMGIEMRYPSMSGLNVEGATKIEKSFNLIAAMISSVYDGDTIHKASSYSNSELVDWIEALPEEVFLKMNTFMENMPKITYNSEVICPSCGEKNVIRLEGLSSFFG